ncbi:MAG: hypothetical protein A2Z59_12200 [Nitrospinae bacterium RIFCSPLOWO2_02_39_17]|nr:MAG: hypothetical protein A2Z59_12200 [Nitrospinae bacterium RIFCSPLOWO2_02_39_17]
MKIAFVIHDINKTGGMERYSAELIERFSKEHEIHVFASTMEGVNPQGQIIFHRIPVIEILFPIKSIIFFLLASWLVKRHSFDIIHGNGGNFYGANIITAHFCHRAWGEAINLFMIDSDKIVKRVYKKIVTRIDSAMEKFVYKSGRCKVVIADSIKTKNELCKFYNIKKESVEIIYYGIDIELFNPSNRLLYNKDIRETFKIPLDSCLLLFVGALGRKGLSFLLRSLKLLKEENIFLIIAGKGDRKYYQREAESFGVDNLIRFAGHRSDIHKFYASADIFVLPTIYEPFGMVVTEAMASGLPVVVSRQAGASELITEGEDGILIKNADDHEEIAHILMPLVKDKDLRQRIGHNARLKVENLSWDKMADETMMMYIKVLADSYKAR